ncbi:hypothetical protein HNP81_003661 [Peribacillus huizhouensis]|uniref:Fur-regulated basic protein FbpA n=1 Tax=Peribacillus huizhouensis TaxID=1501239 RepID=A0ABR6CUC8_9BACI|nr:hypothetical protein [Peribacillus huizhouensis]
MVDVQSKNVKEALLKLQYLLLTTPLVDKLIKTKKAHTENPQG